MEDRSLHPSIFLKIDGKSHLFVRNFCKSQVSTPGISGALAYVPGVLHGHLHPARQGTASMTVQPVTPVFIGAPSEKRNAAPRIFLSFLSLASITVIAPFERVKLLTQCQNEMIKSGRLSHPYKGIGDCFARTVRNEGFISLWRGNTASMLEQTSSKHNMLATAAVGVGVAFCAKLPTYPLDTLHRRMMMRSGEAVKYKSSLDAFSQILKDEGIKSLYKGVGAHFIQLSIVSGLAMVGAKLLLKIFYPKTNASGKQSNRIVINWKNGKDGGPGSR